MCTTSHDFLLIKHLGSKGWENDGSPTCTHALFVKKINFHIAAASNGQGGATANFVEIFSKASTTSKEIQVSSQGTLVIPEAHTGHVGRYLCHVTNGVGQPLHTVVNVTVKVPPAIKVDKARLNAPLNEDHVKLACSADGDRPITVKWSKDGKDVMYGRESRGRYSMETLVTATGIKSVFVISHVVKDDEGVYSCGMTNPFGSDSEMIQLIVQGEAGR
jgi:hypothetical protein